LVVGRGRGGGGGFGGWFDEKWVLVFRVFEEERRG